MDSNLHSPSRPLIELRMERAELNARVDPTGRRSDLDERAIRRFEKSALVLRDKIDQPERSPEPKEPA